MLPGAPDRPHLHSRQLVGEGTQQQVKDTFPSEGWEGRGRALRPPGERTRRGGAPPGRARRKQ